MILGPGGVRAAEDQARSAEGEGRARRHANSPGHRPLHGAELRRCVRAAPARPHQPLHALHETSTPGGRARRSNPRRERSAPPTELSQRPPAAHLRDPLAYSSAAAWVLWLPAGIQGEVWGGRRSWSRGSVWSPPATDQYAFQIYSIFDGGMKLHRIDNCR